MLANPMTCSHPVTIKRLCAAVLAYVILSMAPVGATTMEVAPGGATRQVSQSPQSRFLVGVAQAERGQLEGAILTFTALTKDFPELPEPYNNLAVLYAKKGMLAQAMEVLKIAVKMNPAYSKAHENLGDLHALLATASYNDAAALDQLSAAASKARLVAELFNKDEVPRFAQSASDSGSRPEVKPATPATPAAPVALKLAIAETAGVTLSAIATEAASVSATTGTSADEQGVHATLDQWAQAWSSQSLDGYLASYAEDFRPEGGKSLDAWKAERKLRIEGKKRIRVSINKLKLAIDGDKAQATFRQAYTSNNYSEVSTKHVTLIRKEGRWRIQTESTR
jgi:tetratricopeptide (TPR) repeat protein